MDWDFFTENELTCHCPECDGGEMRPSFMTKLVNLRRELDFPFPINSAYRCKQHNANIGGHKKSYHLLGRAVDIRADHDRAWQIIAAAKKHGFRGIGIDQKGEGRFIHLDDRSQDHVTIFSY